jgi:hypothetical protein
MKITSLLTLKRRGTGEVVFILGNQKDRHIDTGTHPIVEPPFQRNRWLKRLKMRLWRNTDDVIKWF